ncbi:MAG TPA: hypothetical protein VN063_08395 [Methylophilaceae bacterium]|nr:hypothetical protein [Methylophilaceae bacterium]
MKKAPHLLVCISGHGFGHLAQVAPVLNALHGLSPNIRLTVRSTIPQPLLRQRIRPEFNHLQEATDFGMVMVSALEVDVAASMHAYKAFHADWSGNVRAEAARLQAIGADLVLTDVAYLPLAAANQIGLPALSLCSLNWADIFAHYCAGMAGAAGIQQQIEAAYGSANCFLRPTPAMPMPWLERSVAIGLLADVGQSRRSEIDRELELTQEDRLILVSMGGIPTRFPVRQWPRLRHVKWLVQKDWLAEEPREDMLAFEPLGMPFADLLASCDLLLTKPGYGAFAEAAASGIPVLFVMRDDWPEQPYLVDWLTQAGPCQGIDIAQVADGDFATEVLALLQTPKSTPLMVDGNEQAARYLQAQLSAVT